jgi:hypothetical protein
MSELLGVLLLLLMIYAIGSVLTPARRKMLTALRRKGQHRPVCDARNGMNVTRDGELLIATVSKRRVEIATVAPQALLDVEVIENGTSITTTNRASQVGGAVVGALALGGVGAIIGGLSGSKKSESKVDDLRLRVVLGDRTRPEHVINLISGGAHARKSAYYRAQRQVADEWSARLRALRHDSTQEPRAAQESVADELVKLDTLRRESVLTDEEFANEKARLLGSSR